MGNLDGEITYLNEGKPDPARIIQGHYCSRRWIRWEGVDLVVRQLRWPDMPLGRPERPINYCRRTAAYQSSSPSGQRRWKGVQCRLGRYSENSRRVRQDFPRRIDQAVRSA